MRRSSHTALLVCGWLVSGTLGCPLACTAACTEARTHAEQLGRATLTGRVRLSPGAALPSFAAFDLARNPLIAEAADGPTPAGCAEANQRARHAVRATADGLLSGVVVVASDFTGITAAVPPKSRMHVVTIRDCALSPSLLAARAGDWLELRNADRVAFAPQVGPATRENPLAPAQRVMVPLEGGRVTSIMCPPSRPCGRTDLVVLNHPLFAVTGPSGEFRIDGFPHGEMVRVTAWHPLMEPAETFVWLEPDQRAAIELQLSPKERFVDGASNPQR